MPELPVRLHDLIDHVIDLHADGTALDHLGDAVSTGAQLAELQDHLVGHFVDQARRAGASWTEIGASIGVSKQGAQQRFVPKASDLRELLANGAGLLSRFTPRARAVVVGARDDARAAGNDAVSSAHVLFCMAADPGSVASRAIIAQGSSLDDVRLAAAATFAPRVGQRPEHIPFSSEAKSLLELSVREALRMGHNYVGTEHLILGLAADRKSSGGRALAACGLEEPALRTWIEADLAHLARQRGQAFDSSGGTTPGAGSAPADPPSAGAVSDDPTDPST
jgi:hypothetical protein